jgi:hypothetical protein
MYCAAARQGGGCQAFEIKPPVGLIKETGGAIVAALENMQRNTSEF